MSKVVDLLDRESNIFDALRLLAATLVIFSHSYAMVGLKEPTFLDSSWGAFGVHIFFILSGLLIAVSWMSHPRVSAFMGKRLLRILPALSVVIFATAFIVGPLFTTLSLKQYFSDNLTYQYLNGISVFGLVFTLPGVFSKNNPVVNGSLWTLPYEMFAYMTVAFLGRTLLLKKKQFVIGLYAACIILFLLTKPPNNNLVLFTLNFHYLVMFLSFFLSGVICALYKESIMLAWPGALVGISLLLIVPTKWAVFTSFFVLPYLVLYAASLTHLGLEKVGRYGDFSYGMYIFAWPIQQILVKLHGGNIGHNQLFIYTLLITLMLSIVSWHYVEKPMLKKKICFNVDKYPLTSDVW